MDNIYPVGGRTAKLSTENSDFDTVLAIYKVGEGEGWDALEEVASDDNGGVMEKTVKWFSTLRRASRTWWQ